MKNVLMAAALATGICSAIEAAPTDAVTQADLQMLIERITKLEAENKAQAARIAELEAAGKTVEAKVAEQSVQIAAKADAPKADAAKADESTQVSESGKVYTTASGKKYFLADATANIFEPLSESGLQITPYGWLVLEGVYNTHGTDYPMYTDYVRPKNAPGHAGKDHTSTLSVNDSILGFQFATPEVVNGWKFNGKFEFDLAGDNANKTDFHVRHLYWNMEHETGWSILFGQTWHIWKMVSPSEIDGAWMENTGYPYRRSPQIRVTKRWDWEDSSLEARVGLVKNGPGMGGDRDGNGTEDNEQSAWCLFEGALVYDHVAPWEEGDRRALIGIAGQYGRERAHRLSGYGFGLDPDTGAIVQSSPIYDGPNDSYNSDLVMIAASVPFLDKFTLCGQVFAGENLGGVQAGVGQKIAFTDPTRKGREVTTVGGFVDLKYELNETWSFAAGYGFDNPNVSSRDVEIHTRGDYAGITYNDRAYIDAFYQFNENLHFGVEYAYLTTDYVGEQKDNDSHRLQFSVYYDF